ncbi:hypothetical protein Bpfe_019152 [Biomphalaria pfeifferi]|uniref:Uncharacterized protein n=1 Tax=Biomphalaria pfeifferi TaxID=112525 RepID=A0AAD8F5G6_BIOPF|nr:hypothetical protein Bpfe_019152 [Biomphalaria pfeifferi]
MPQCPPFLLGPTPCSVIGSALDSSNVSTKLPSMSTERKEEGDDDRKLCLTGRNTARVTAAIKLKRRINKELYVDTQARW